MRADTPDNMIKQLPDLPALECVEVRLVQRPVLAAIALAFVVGFLSFAWFVYSGLSSNTSDIRHVWALGLTFGVISCLYLLYRLLLTDFYWHTDASGLGSRSLLRRRFAPWESVTAMPREATTIPEISVLVPLAASIWQHLRRCGREHVVSLPDSAITFWDSFPDELRDTMEWVNPKPVRLNRRLTIMALCALLTVAVAFVIAGRLTSTLADSSGWAWISLLWASSPALYLVLYLRHEPESIRLTPQMLEARLGRRTISIDLAEVVSAEWAGPNTLLIRSRSNAKLLIGIDTRRDESAQFALALIRWLRSAPMPVMLTIPEMLRSSYEAEFAVAQEQDGALDSVEVRLTLVDRASFSVFAFMLAASIVASMVCGPKSLGCVPLIASLAAVLLVCAAVWHGTGSFSMIADRSGFTKQIFGWKRYVRWDHVADFTTGNQAGSGIHKQRVRRLLESRNGRVLASISPQCGTKEDWARFMRFVYARLSEVLPPDKSRKPWKARPWETRREN